MSIFFDFDVGPYGRRFRRAVDGDKHDIVLYIDKELEQLFGVVDVGSLIELSTLSLCMINEQKEVVGFIALCDHPNIPAVDPADWETWIRNMFQRFYLSRNTLFIHYLCCKDSALDVFLDEAVGSVFDNDMYLQQIILTIPPGCPDGIMNKHPAMKKKNVYKHYAKQQEDANQYIYAFIRQEFCSRLKMRRAVEEDNDDIVKILDNRCPRLRDLYGDYYISELIGRHPESKRKIIVTEYKDRAVGVMGLNSDVNYEKLDNTYDLRPYHGLTKATAFEREQMKRNNTLLTHFGDPIALGEWSPFKNLNNLDVFQPEDEVPGETTDVEVHKKQSKVNFGRQAMRKSMDHIMFRSAQQSDDFSDGLFPDSPFQSQNVPYSVADLLDEDPFDYEIVNIDHKLLTFPEVFSYESAKSERQEMNTICEMSERRHSRTTSFKIGPKLSEHMEFPYKGEPNAFTIELLGFQEGFHERHVFDLLEAAFEIMQDYDYCILEVPCTDMTFSLLQHFCFVPTKPGICSTYALYVAHRAAIVGKLRVREVELMDVPQLASLLQDLEAKETLWTIENSIQSKELHRAYVFQSGLSIVGVGILEAPEQTDFIRSKFNLDLYHIQKYHLRGCGTPGGFSTLKVAQVYSVFEVHFRFFVRDMLRLSNCTSMMWLTAYRNKWIAHKANSFASVMVPLVPRKTEIDCTVIAELRHLSSLSKKITAFSTWFLDKKLSTVPKVDVNVRIVVVGASRTAMAFLNSLLFSNASTYLTFTSVTLVSTNGLPYIRHANPIAEMMFPRYRTHMDKYLKSVPYSYYVNIVQGIMVEVDNQHKFIKLSNGNKYHYDLLFLLCGQQYQHPNYLKEIYDREEKLRDGRLPSYFRLDVPEHADVRIRIATDRVPENVFIVNSMAIANKAINFVRNISAWKWRKDHDKVIVYGASIHAYCCLAALLETNIPHESIVFVEPFPPEDPLKTRVPVFCNANVDRTVQEVLGSMKITIYRSYYFESWTLDDCNFVTSVQFLSDARMLQLSCSAFFYYGKRGISAHTLEAISKSSIVYDGGILIDHQYKTKDPAVYAAGPATRYCRRYFADTYRQKYYDSYEVGEKLGTQIRNQLDPLFSESKKQAKRKSTVTFSVLSDKIETATTRSNKSDSVSGSERSSENKRASGSIEDRDYKIPSLKKPITIHCYLPGGLQYLEIRPSGLKLPNYYIQTLNYNGFLMETFKGGYFKIHMTNDYIVDGVTCLCREKTSLENFKHLFGLPSIVLNNVYLRYASMKLDNFYEFFRSPWAYFLYHEQCDELFAMTKELRPKGQRNGNTLAETLESIKHTLNKQDTILLRSFQITAKSKIRSIIDHSAHVEAITDYVMDWLSENDVLLPMYFQQSYLMDFQHDIDTNPAFKKRKTSLVELMKKIF